MKRRWWQPKVCSALVLCAGLATLIAAWRIDVAGKGALKAGRCTDVKLQGKGVELEMARSRAQVLRILGRPEEPAALDPDGRPKGACLRDGLAAQTHGDNYLLVAYSLLTWTLFLFVGSLRFPVKEGERPTRWLMFGLLGLLYALAMGSADFLENRSLFKLIDLAGQISVAPEAAFGAVLPGLRLASGVKLGALALSAALLGLLWPSASGRWVVCPARVLAWQAALLLGFALVRDDAPAATLGVFVLALFWLAALVHAVAVAVHREPPPEIPPPSGQQPNSAAPAEGSR